MYAAVVRAPSPPTAAERAPLAGHLSALHRYARCHGVHAATARPFGIADARREAVAGLDAPPRQARATIAFACGLVRAPGRSHPLGAGARPEVPRPLR